MYVTHVNKHTEYKPLACVQKASFHILFSGGTHGCRNPAHTMDELHTAHFAYPVRTGKIKKEFLILTPYNAPNKSLFLPFYLYLGGMRLLSNPFLLAHDSIKYDTFFSFVCLLFSCRTVTVDSYILSFFFFLPSSLLFLSYCYYIIFITGGKACHPTIQVIKTFYIFKLPQNLRLKVAPYSLELLSFHGVIEPLCIT